MYRHKWPVMFLSAFTVVTVLVGLAAGLFIPQRANAQDSVVNITLGSWDDQNGNVRHLAAIADFEAQYPNIHVEIQPNPGGDWHSRILTLIASGGLADVYMADSSYVPLYVEAGGLTDLRPYIEGANGFNPNDLFYQSVYQNGFYRGDPYVLAKDYSTIAVYANKSLFDAAGITLPAEGWTYDDLLNIAEQLTVDANGNNATSPDFDPTHIVQYGMDHRSDWFRSFETVIYSFGSHTISQDGSTLDGFFNSPAAISAYEWMRDAVQKYHVAPTSNYISSLPGGVMPEFLAGHIAMVFGNGPWYQDTLDGQPGFKYAILPMPTGPGGHHEAVCWAGFGLAPTSQHPNEAWLLLKALATDIGQKQYSQHALSAMPSFMQGKTNDPFWGTFISEVQYLDPLDDLRNPYYLQCVGTPAGSEITAVLFGESGASIDVAQLVNDRMPVYQACMDNHGEAAAAATPAQ